MHYAAFGSAMYLEEQTSILAIPFTEEPCSGKNPFLYERQRGKRMSVLNDAPRSLSFNYRQPAMGRAASTGLGGLLGK